MFQVSTHTPVKESPVALALACLFESHHQYRSPFGLNAGIESSFSKSYSEARFQFLNAALASNATLEEYQLFTLGTDGKPLFIDFAILQNGTPKRVLLHISGTHGPEGFAGSAIQVDLLQRGIVVPENTMIIFCHGLNPFGMDTHQRTNEDNIDPNRNNRLTVADFQKGLCAKADFDSLDWLAHPENETALLNTLELLGKSDPTLRAELLANLASIFPGQNHRPEGLFYSGLERCQSFNFLNHFLDQQLPASVQDIFVVDVHTGLGQFGEEMLFSNAQALLSDTQDLYQTLCQKPGIMITPPDPAAPNFYEAQGDTVQGLTERMRLTGIACNGICQEFGTYAFPALVATLIAENFYRAHTTQRPEWVVNALREIFNPENSQWQASIIAQGRRLYDALHSSFLTG